METDVVLVDLDLAAPALAVRLGRPPRPDVTDAADEVHATGSLPAALVQRHGPLRLVVGSHRNGETASPDLTDDVITALAGTGARVVVDAGPRPGNDPLLLRADDVVLVACGTPTGLVRAATLVSGWVGPTPRLVLNKVPDRCRDDVIGAARRWTGLEPAAVLPPLRSVAGAARSAHTPPRGLRRALRHVDLPG
jgi:MinD-like ATPase involved in chromosome partitioning or flagellar assembly